MSQRNSRAALAWFAAVLAAQPEILGVPRKRWRGVQFSLYLSAAVLLVLAAVFMLVMSRSDSPVQAGVLYPFLYLQTIVLALVVGAIAGLIGRILKAHPKE